MLFIFFDVYTKCKRDWFASCKMLSFVNDVKELCKITICAYEDNLLQVFNVSNWKSNGLIYIINVKQKQKNNESQQQAPPVEHRLLRMAMLNI